MAVVSGGTYPTPTPTSTQRAAYAISYGLLGLMPGVGFYKYRKMQLSKKAFLKVSGHYTPRKHGKRQ